MCTRKDGQQVQAALSAALMEKLRILQKLLVKLGISLPPEWLSSAQNYFADKHSGNWHPGDLKVPAQAVAVVNEYAHIRLDVKGALAYQPLGVHPVAMRKGTLAALKGH